MAATMDGAQKMDTIRWQTDRCLFLCR